MTNKQVALLCIVVAVTSAGVTHFYFPQIQTKTVETTRDVVRTDIQTVVHTVQAPNGQIDTTTTIIDHTQKVETSSKTEVKILPKDWLVSGYAGSSIHLEPIVYGAQVQRRILGPLFLGVQGNTKGEVGLTLGMEF